MKIISLPLLSAFALFAATTGVAMAHTPAAVKVGTTAKGPTLTDAQDMTLYTFDKDTDGKSACVDACAVAWPPLAADSTTHAHGDWSRIDRADGSQQWAYHGKPLYRWKNDMKPGDITGDGLLHNSWHVAQP